MRTLALLFVLMSTQVMAQQNLQLKKDSQVTWQGKAAFSSYSPVGTLDISQSSVKLQNDSLTSLMVSIDMSSLRQENKQLEGHLREADFFHVEKFPQATFTLTQAIPLESETVILEGVMTIKGQSKKEQIPAKITRTTMGLTIEFNSIFDRTDYGINYNSPSFFKRLKENAIADEFKLKAILEYVEEN